MKPIVMGAFMGLMMIWMIHGQMTGTSSLAGWALIGFVAVHIILIGAAVSLSIWAARLSPRARAILDKLHRPSFQHLTMMIVGMVATAESVHLIIHGGIA